MHHWLPNVSIAILVITFAVTIHELGHFLAAKNRGVKILEFGLGIGIGGSCHLFTWKGTKFMVSPRSSQILILLAGPVANIFCAMVLFSILHYYQIPDISIGGAVVSGIVRAVSICSMAFS